MMISDIFEYVQTKPTRKLEFIAKTVADLGKGIAVVGVASYFFEKLPLLWRISIGTTSVLLIFIGIMLYPEEGG